MELKKIYAVYFSAVGNTKKAVEMLAGKIAGELDVPWEAIDFTLPAAREQAYCFDKTNLVVFGTPVYAGRVPNKVLPFVQTLFEGNDALAVPVVTFGNRSFDDGLMEMRNELEEHGFHTIAAAALTAPHVMSDMIAADRPDEEDVHRLREFSKEIAAKTSEIRCGQGPIAVDGRDPVGPYYTPLQEDGTPAKFLKAKPKTREELCTKCGICVKVCPMGSISEDMITVEGICIKCQACIRKCPEHAKYFDDPQLLSHIRMLEANYARRAENKYYI